MKTTMEISDTLLEEARRVALREGTTLRALVERGLHHVLKEAAAAVPFRLRAASFKGEGLQRSAGQGREEVRGSASKDRGA